MGKAEKLKEASQWYDENKELYERCARNKTEIITKILQSKGIPYHSITYRVKDKKSYCDKCEKDKYVDPLNEIMDLSGIRIIAYTNNDVHKICEIIREEFIIDEENSMDKYDIMKENQVGYLSVHFIAKLKEDRTNLIEYQEYAEIKSEIQVRTLLQHAWAEIEHDRNYKFFGVLPKNISRKFYLLAGVLELVDNKFDSLSNEIDSYVKETKLDVTRGKFDIAITSNSVEQYMIEKYGNNKNLKPCANGQIVDNEIIEELINFGFNTIKDLDENLKDEYIMSDDTYIGFLRNVMICKDAEKYFKNSYKKQWSVVSRNDVIFWESLGAKNVREYIERCDIRIEPEEDILELLYENGDWE